jgi:hypothetical protein
MGLEYLRVGLDYCETDGPSLLLGTACHIFVRFLSKPDSALWSSTSHSLMWLTLIASNSVDYRLLRLEESDVESTINLN